MKSTLLLAAFSTMVAAYPTTDPQKVAGLEGTDTQLDKLDILSKDSDWLFDFYKQKTYTNKPGSVVTASAANFPAVVGNKLSLALITLGPCSMLPPHIHPRASNYVVSVKGQTQTYYISENGGRRVDNLLKEGQMTIFPAASLHTMFNTGCEDSVLVSALSDEDPGTHNVANGIFGFPSDLVSQAFGGSVDYKKVEGAIPPVNSKYTGAIAGTESCLKKCKAAGKL